MSGPGERHFGDAAGQISGSGERHFGSVAGPMSGAGERHFGAASRGVFLYHGHSFARFAASPYRWPGGYAYRRYAVGGVLPRAFWVRDYYIDNYVDYGLEAPLPDFEWVRYGPDIVLVNLDTGDIAQVVYGVFDEADAPTADAEQPAAN